MDTERGQSLYLVGCSELFKFNNHFIYKEIREKRQGQKVISR